MRRNLNLPVFIFSFLLLMVLFLCLDTSATAQDPYEDVSFHALSNGLVVVLAPNPNAKTFYVKVRVKVGSAVEGKDNLGVSHLLEHLVFRDSRFDNDQTYLQVIKEAGGTINAYVQKDLTAYYARSPASKGEWLVSEIAEMLFDQKIAQDDIDRAKSSVELETGEPSWFAGLLGADIFAFFFNRYFKTPDFMESEFGISYPAYSSNEIKLSVRKLSRSQLLEHYASYYRPSNMVLFVAGKFTRKKMLALIEREFGTYADRPGKTVSFRRPEPNNKPYSRVEANPFYQPHIYVGTKVLNPTAMDEVVLYVYLDYIAHRLMKELRNKLGETYSAQSYGDEQSGAGYGIVGFETTRDEFRKNLNYVQRLIDREARQGGLTDQEIAEAIKLAKGQDYELADADAETLMSYAEDYYDFREDHAAIDSPYGVITSLTAVEFRDSLERLFTRENAYTYLYVPYMYTKIEPLLLLLLSTIVSIIIFKKVFKRKVDETQIRWSQKMAFTPGMFIEILAIIAMSFMVSYLITAPLERYVTLTDWYNSSSLWPLYMLSSVETFIVVGIATGFLALCPRKLMVEGEDLVIKSMALYARRFRKSSVKSIRTISLFKLLFSPKIWFTKRFRYFYNDLFFWRKGLLLEINEGPIYFLAFKNAGQVVSALDQHLMSNPAERPFHDREQDAQHSDRPGYID